MEDRLAKFAGIVEAGSFTRAAAVMRISQPALTTAVKKLERQLGAELLIRGNHALTLTAAGVIAYETAKKLITETQNLETRIREAAKRNVILNLGLIDSLANLLFVESDDLGKLEQGAQVSLTIDNSSRLIDGINHSKLDIALVARPERLQPSLVAETIGEEPLVLVARPGSARRAKAGIASKHLRQFISYNQASRTYLLVAGHFAKQGISLQPTFHSTSPEIMLRLVLAGRGAAVLPYSLTRPLLKQGKLQAVPIGDSPVINRTIICLYRAGRAIPAQGGEVLAHTRRELKNLIRAANQL